MMQLLSGGRRFPAPSGGRSVDHAQQRADRQLTANLEPWVELLPRPTVHPNLAALAALATADKNRAPGTIEIALLKRERFADPQPSAPEQHDQRPQPVAIGAVTDTTHHCDDLLDGRRVG